MLSLLSIERVSLSSQIDLNVAPFSRELIYLPLLFGWLIEWRFSFVTIWELSREIAIFANFFYLSYKLVLAGSTISLWMWKKITLFPSWCLCRLFGHGHSQQQNFPSTFGDSSPFPSFLTNCCYFVLKYTLEKEEWRKWQTFQFSDRNLLRNCRGLIFTFHFSFLAYLTLMLTQSHTLTMCRKYDCFLLLAAGVLVFFFSRSPSNFSPTLVHLHVHVELMRKKSRR